METQHFMMQLQKQKRIQYRVTISSAQLNAAPALNQVALIGKPLCMKAMAQMVLRY